MSNSPLMIAATDLKQWMLEHSFPLWWQTDRLSSGLFYEVLDFDGNAVTAARARVRVQARQIYSFALAHDSGFAAPLLVDALNASLRAFLDTCLRDDGVAGRAVDVHTTTMIDDTPDLYDTAFCLLAVATCHGIADNVLVEQGLSRLLSGLDTTMSVGSDNGFAEMLPRPEHRHQNPHMHLFESLLAVYEKQPTPELLEHIDRLFEFIDRMFFDKEQHIVHERVMPDGTRFETTFEPGHSLEWVWLLGRYAELTARPVSPFAAQLYQHYLNANIAEAHTPMKLSVTHEAVDSSMRLWSQTECLKAHLRMFELGDSQAAARAVQCAQEMKSRWLDTAYAGGWNDHYDADWQLIATNMPASSGYHLYTAIAELDRVARLTQA
ncbi:MAG: AGE family epimerase/isomerase [Pseudomonadota bacterium]